MTQRQAIAAARNGQRSALVWPARDRDGRTVWLSSGQRALLFYVRAMWRYGRHTHRLVDLARASGIDVSNVSRGLDRLASLGVIGRRSTRGCLGTTTTWALRARTSRALRFRTNVATSTPYGVYLSRERWALAAAQGERNAVRRLSPPRMLYGRCAAGHRTRLSRWTYRRYPGADRSEVRSFEGVWIGACRRCGTPVRQTVTATVRAPIGSGGWTRAGELLTAVHTIPGAQRPGGAEHG